ncbi:MAG: hypothetical protein HPY57_13985 [Ignavibacteria bacterium]|nr:hypothetical protein [Ignavibacteria bacterium]
MNNNNKIGNNNGADKGGIYRNSIGNNFNRNVFEDYVGDIRGRIIIGNDFQCNYVRSGAIPSNTDFTLATHVYGDYDCELYRRSDGTPRLKYYDNTDTLNVVNITD